MASFGQALPSLRVAPAGPESVAWIERLARSECPAFTARRTSREEASGTSQVPIVWTEALGSNVRDADGNVYVDLTSGFGAAAVGHRHPRVIAAVEKQLARLPHALGDLHPSDTKIRLLEALVDRAPWPNARVALGLSGSDAVEIALKTAALFTGRPGVIAFRGSYHGLAYGPLSICGYGESLRAPFADQLNPHVTFVDFPAPNETVEGALTRIRAAWSERTGALIVEPILGRGGVCLPPAGFLRGLTAIVREQGGVLIADEILTGLGRCGAALVSVEEGALPDLVCIGKALGGGFPISACLGRSEVMDAWASAKGSVVHTGTFLGNPLGCASALATLDVIDDEGLGERATAKGTAWRAKLTGALAHVGEVEEVRGRGLLVGVTYREGGRALSIVAELLSRGFLALPAGVRANVVQFVPPLTISETLLDATVDALKEIHEPR